MIRALIKRSLRRKPKEEIITILYTIDNDACEWSRWNIKLTPKEARLYRRAVKKKQDLLDVLRLDSVLARAEKEIMAFEQEDYPPRVIFDDPNYPAGKPDDSISLFLCPSSTIAKVEKMLREYEKSANINCGEDKTL